MSAKLLQLGSTLCDPMDCSCQVLLSMEFSRKEYWSGLPSPPPGDLPNPGIEPVSQVPPALAGEFFFLITKATWEAPRLSIAERMMIIFSMESGKQSHMRTETE